MEGLAKITQWHCILSFVSCAEGFLSLLFVMQNQLPRGGVVLFEDFV